MYEAQEITGLFTFSIKWDLVIFPSSMIHIHKMIRNQMMEECHPVVNFRWAFGLYNLFDNAKCRLGLIHLIFVSAIYVMDFY